MSVHLEHKKVGEYHVITSPDVPGLYVADRDELRAEELVAIHLEALAISQQRREQRKRGNFAAT